MKLTRDQITEIASSIGVDYASLMAFISVESGGLGFATDTGKIIIQFEPAWFRKKAPYAPSGLWSLNKVERQSEEWKAFNNAYSIDQKAALLSTSIGLMQVMGFNYASCGYTSVNDMWDDFKKGEYQQVKGAANFIKSNSALWGALKSKNWPKVAYNYNGSNYKVNNYDKKMEAAYNKYNK